MSLLQWRQEILDRVKKLTNGELVNETLSLAAGDDYDGCMTARGAWEFKALQEELYTRLFVAEFLTESEIETLKYERG